MGLTIDQLALDPRQPHVALPGRWTFWAESMVGSQVLGMVDVGGFYCVKRLSDFGYGNVTLNLPCGLDSDTILTLWSWRLWAFYAGEPYFCGVPTGLADENGSERVTLTLTELPGYLRKRQWDVWPDRKFVNWEQTAIARELAQPVEEVGVQIVTEPGAPPVLRDRTYEALEGGSRGQLLANLSGVLGGPEWRTEYRMLGTGRPQCVLRIASSRVGSDEAGLGISVPGAVLAYRYQMDSDRLRTHTFAVGDLPHADDQGNPLPEGTPRPVKIAILANPRLPRLDAVDDWPGTVNPSTLEERAVTNATIYSIPSQELTGSPPESYPALGTYGPGDTVTVRAVTPLIPEGIEFAARLTQVEVNAATGVATWHAVFLSPPQATRNTINGTLERLTTGARQLFYSGGLRRI